LEVYRTHDGTRIAVIAASWELNPKVTFESLAEQFRQNEVLAWQNYGSVLLKTQGAMKALRDPGILERFANKARQSPWDPYEETFTPIFRGVPGRRYFVHVDQSKNNDRTGVAMTHREPGTTRWVVDFMVEITPAPGKQIDYAGLRQRFVYNLHKVRDFNIVRVSYDGWQSEEARQQLEKDGYEVELISVDRNRLPYDTLIGLLNEEKLDYYEFEPFFEQMRELEVVRGLKYDHPKRFRNGQPGRKDVADAVAGSLANGLLWERDNPEELGMLYVHANPAFMRKDPYGERRLR